MNAHLTLVSIMNEESTIEKLKLRRSSIQSLANERLNYLAEIVGLDRDIAEREVGLMAFLGYVESNTPHLGADDEENGEVVEKRA